MSKANDIAAVIATRLATIRTSNGYETDAGQTVYRGKRNLSAGNCITLFEGEEDATRPRGEPYTANAIMHFIAEGVVACDPENPDIAGHKLVADIQKAIFSTDHTLSGLLASPIIYTGRVIQPRADGSPLVSAQVRLDATYTITPANP